MVKYEFTFETPRGDQVVTKAFHAKLTKARTDEIAKLYWLRRGWVMKGCEETEAKGAVKK